MTSEEWLANFKAEQAKIDSLICTCGHPHSDHAGFGGGCLACTMHIGLLAGCMKFTLPGDMENKATRFPSDAEL